MLPKIVAFLHPREASEGFCAHSKFSAVVAYKEKLKFDALEYEYNFVII